MNPQQRRRRVASPLLLEPNCGRATGNEARSAELSALFAELSENRKLHKREFAATTSSPRRSLSSVRAVFLRSNDPSNINALALPRSCRAVRCSARQTARTVGTRNWKRVTRSVLTQARAFCPSLTANSAILASGCFAAWIGFGNWNFASSRQHPLDRRRASPSRLCWPVVPSFSHRSGGPTFRCAV